MGTTKAWSVRPSDGWLDGWSGAPGARAAAAVGASPSVGGEGNGASGFGRRRQHAVRSLAGERRRGKEGR